MAANLNRHPAAERAHRSPVAALDALLDDLADTILALPAEVYTAGVDPKLSGTVGAHVRHTLDHIAAFVSNDTGTLCYDHRERGTAVETEPSAALRQILRLKAALARWADRCADDPLLVRSLVSADGDEVTAWSSFGRELAFVVCHTIHHHALIALVLAWHGVAVPDRFGMAPSTPTA